MRLKLCVEIGVQLCFPELFFIGFNENNDPTVRRKVVDVYRNLTGACWAFRDGTWVIDDSLDARKRGAYIVSRVI